MKKSHLAKTMIAVAIFTSGFVSAISAQDKAKSSGNKSTTTEVKIQEQTISSEGQDKPLKYENIVALKFKGPNDTWVKTNVIEGGAFRIQDKSTGKSFAFFPVVDSTNRKNVTVKVCHVIKTESSEKIDEIESLRIPLGSSKTTTTNPPFDIYVEAVVRHVSMVGDTFEVSKEKNRQQQ